MKKVILAVTLLCVIPSVCAAGVMKSTIDDQASVEVTVYNSNVGLIKDTRRVDLPTGPGEMQFMDVASGINPVSVAVKSISEEASFTVLEQNYEYDLISSDKLLDKYVGKNVKIVDENEYQGTKEELDAELLSNNDGQIYRIGGQIFLGHSGRVVLPEIPENLIAKPTLTWEFKNDLKTPQELEVSYLTKGINWTADYVMTVDQQDAGAGLNGWVTIDNRSGTQYRDAALKLVAGTVNRVQDYSRMQKGYPSEAMAFAPGAGSGFQEQAFFEYHIYDLQRPTTIKNNQTKQISLLEAQGIKIDKKFILYGDQGYYSSRVGEDAAKVDVGVYIQFKNEEDNKLGMPLPAGTVRLYKEDSKGKLQFIGEDRIGHTPKDEQVRLKIGNAFDVVAERKQTDFQNVGSYITESEWEITIRNHKQEDVQVSVVEAMYGEWQVLNATHSYKKLDTQRIEFSVPAAKDQSAVLKYRVRISQR